MTLFNYREVAERFSPIDADFVSASVSLPEREARYAVRFYPLWEHPRYLDRKISDYAHITPAIKSSALRR